ncbi:MAG: DUF3617 family protein [Acidobacteriota bacterium]
MVMKILAGVLAAGALAFVGPEKPPMKLGLWSTQVSTSVKVPGMDLPPGMSTPKEVKVKACLTQATWTKQMGGGPQAAGCKTSGEVWTPNSYASDISCETPQANATGHIAVRWPDMEHSEGTVHMEIDASGQHVVTDSVVTSRFLSADCGGVRPEKPEVER